MRGPHRRTHSEENFFQAEILTFWLAFPGYFLLKIHVFSDYTKKHMLFYVYRINVVRILAVRAEKTQWRKYVRANK